MSKLKQLKQLLIDRVDLVDKGDNPEATIALYKRKEDSTLPKNSVQKGEIQVTDAMKKLLEQVPEALQDKIAKQMSDEEEAKRKKQEEEEKKKEEEEEKKKEEEKKEDEDEDEEEKKKADSKDDDVMKTLPEDVRKKMESYEKRASKAEAVAKKLQDDILNKEYIAKAEKLDQFATTAEELGPIMKRVADNNEEDFGKLEALLTAANEALAKNNILVEEIGKAGKTEIGGDAWQKVEAGAEELMKSDSKLTKETAIAKVLMNNPELHKQYHQETEEVQ